MYRAEELSLRDAWTGAHMWYEELSHPFNAWCPISYSPDGKLLEISSPEGVVLCDAATPAIRRRWDLSGPLWLSPKLAWSSNGRVLTITRHTHDQTPVFLEVDGGNLVTVARSRGGRGAAGSCKAERPFCRL